MSYSQASGVGANVGYNHDSGVGGNVSWSQHDGFGGGLSYASVQNEAKTNSMAGTGANIAWSERGGTSVNITAASGKGGKNNMSQYGSGGATAGSWSSEGGFKTNSNFLDDKWAQDYLEDAENHREAVDALQSQGFSKDQANAILDARSQSESRAAQDRNNAHQGADAIAGAGYEGTRREGENGTQTHSNGESGDPVDQRIAQLKKELSEGISLAHDNGTMSDAGNPVLAGAAKELSSKMAELKQLEGQKAASIKPGVQKDGSINVVGDRTPTLGERAASLFSSAADGAKGLWDRATGGGQKLENTNSFSTNSGIYEKDGIRMPFEYDKSRGDIPFSNPRSQGPHGAIDFIVPERTPVRAVADGVVGKVHNKPDNFLNNADPNKQNKTLGGAAINLMHDNGNGGKLTTYYAHNSQILVKPGQLVKKGEIIAYSGNSGNSGKAHSHYTIYLNGNYNMPTDPMTYNWDKDFYGK
ncbi:peptidase, M23 family [Leptospira noguchii str. 2007001578]|uniref:Peptidase, M23 family n=1 Tax=Leptospira noguchii str. 2007001578 TaxID=1049974 RepID=A0ABN0IUW8_9LEPT|nr:peptidase, M23 family [Leptospira noguchii str. 2007001578]